MLDNLFISMVYDVFFVIPVVAGSSPVVHPIYNLLINNLSYLLI